MAISLSMLDLVHPFLSSSFVYYSFPPHLVYYSSYPILYSLFLPSHIVYSPLSNLYVFSFSIFVDYIL
ncbi:hypothetical protein BCR42DRAFT_365538 [Absidia repens]|uniref:Uncharacterized protein n=1 Tax=Absidia repens TaxID=90262 RepID=A0A1X2IZY0_9FUNG|nr:hypothetical protein BCR42DRAFT_365538 [Absidia repens]